MTLSNKKSKSKTARVEKRFKWWRENKKKKENSSENNVESPIETQKENDEEVLQNTKAKSPENSNTIKSKNLENASKTPKNKKLVNSTNNTTNDKIKVNDKTTKIELPSTSNKTKKQKLSKQQYVVFVGKLTKETTKEDLAKHFERCGGVKEVRLLTDKGTGESRKCAYVELYDKQSHMGALKLNKSKLKGSSINVEFTSRGRKTFHRMKRLRHKNNTIASRFRNSRDYRKEASKT